MIVSPDAGGVYRAKKFRYRSVPRGTGFVLVMSAPRDGLRHYGLDTGLAMIIKQRLRANVVDRMDLVGDVKGADCIIVDDMIDTGGPSPQ